MKWCEMLWKNIGKNTETQKCDFGHIDFGIVIGADQVSTNLIIVKQLTLSDIKPLQVKIIP